MKTATLCVSTLLVLTAACKGGGQTTGPSTSTASAATAEIKLTGAAKAGFVSNGLLSRGKKVVSKRSGAEALTDGKYKVAFWKAGTPSEERPATAAIEIGKGPSRLLLTWTASGNYDYTDTTFGAPGAYKIETSADSTNGEDGSWKTALAVKDNDVKTRVHAFDFANQTWVRFSVSAPTQKSAPNGVTIDEIAIHDASQGVNDTWFFLGDSISAFAFDQESPAHQPSFADVVHTQNSAYFPLMLNGGIGGISSKEALERLPKTLEANADAKIWAIGLGTNDAAGDATSAVQFKLNMQAIIDKLKAAGKTPILARIPFASKEHAHIDLFNQVVDDLTKENKLTKGPDLYAHFKAHPDELADGIHPTNGGIVSINRLWAASVSSLYK